MIRWSSDTLVCKLIKYPTHTHIFIKFGWSRNEAFDHQRWLQVCLLSMHRRCIWMRLLLSLWLLFLLWASFCRARRGRRVRFHRLSVFLKLDDHVNRTMSNDDNKFLNSSSNSLPQCTYERCARELALLHGIIQSKSYSSHMRTCAQKHCSISQRRYSRLKRRRRLHRNQCIRCAFLDVMCDY